MSCWTHIVASIEIDTHIVDKGIKTRIENILANAPKITGSECNADIFVSVPSGHSVCISNDCESCKYKDTIVQLCEESFNCDADDDYKCPEGEYQTRVGITIVGNLRNRNRTQTLKEYSRFITFLSNDKNNFEIKNSSYNIIVD